MNNIVKVIEHGNGLMSEWVEEPMVKNIVHQLVSVVNTDYRGGKRLLFFCACADVFENGEGMKYHMNKENNNE